MSTSAPHRMPIRTEVMYVHTTRRRGARSGSPRSIT